MQIVVIAVINFLIVH